MRLLQLKNKIDIGYIKDGSRKGRNDIRKILIWACSFITKYQLRFKHFVTKKTMRCKILVQTNTSTLSSKRVMQMSLCRSFLQVKVERFFLVEVLIRFDSKMPKVLVKLYVKNLKNHHWEKRKHPNFSRQHQYQLTKSTADIIRQNYHLLLTVKEP